MACHGNIWHAIAGQCPPAPWGIIAACWSARSKTGETMERGSCLDVDSSTLKYTQVILISCCISFSFVIVHAEREHLSGILRSYQSYQIYPDFTLLSTHPVNSPKWRRMWHGLLFPMPAWGQSSSNSVRAQFVFLWGNVWPVPVYAILCILSIYIPCIYWYLLFVIVFLYIAFVVICWHRPFYMIWEDSRPPTRVLLLNNMVGAGDVDEDRRSVKVAVTSFITVVRSMAPCSKNYGLTTTAPS